MLHHLCAALPAPLDKLVFEDASVLLGFIQSKRVRTDVGDELVPAFCVRRSAARLLVDAVCAGHMESLPELQLTGRRVSQFRAWTKALDKRRDLPQPTVSAPEEYRNGYAAAPGTPPEDEAVGSFSDFDMNITSHLGADEEVGQGTGNRPQPRGPRDLRQANPDVTAPRAAPQMRRFAKPVRGGRSKVCASCCQSSGFLFPCVDCAAIYHGECLEPPSCEPYHPFRCHECSIKAVLPPLVIPASAVADDEVQPTDGDAASSNVVPDYTHEDARAAVGKVFRVGSYQDPLELFGADQPRQSDIPNTVRRRDGSQGSRVSITPEVVGVSRPLRFGSSQGGSGGSDGDTAQPGSAPMVRPTSQDSNGLNSVGKRKVNVWADDGDDDVIGNPAATPADQPAREHGALTPIVAKPVIVLATPGRKRPRFPLPNSSTPRHEADEEVRRGRALPSVQAPTPEVLAPAVACSATPEVLCTAPVVTMTPEVVSSSAGGNSSPDGLSPTPEVVAPAAARAAALDTAIKTPSHPRPGLSTSRPVIAASASPAVVVPSNPPATPEVTAPAVAPRRAPPPQTFLGHFTKKSPSQGGVTTRLASNSEPAGDVISSRITPLGAASRSPLDSRVRSSLGTAVSYAAATPMTTHVVLSTTTTPVAAVSTASSQRPAADDPSYSHDNSTNDEKSPTALTADFVAKADDPVKPRTTVDNDGSPPDCVPLNPFSFPQADFVIF